MKFYNQPNSQNQMFIQSPKKQSNSPDLERRDFAEKIEEMHTSQAKKKSRIVTEDISKRL